MLTGKPQARFGFDISLYESVEVLVDIHPLVQYAHHINQVGAGNSVVQRVRSNSVLTLAVVKDEWVGAGQTILPCDLNTFWDPRTTKRADKFIVDRIDEHELFAEMGYFPDGLPTIVAETGEVLADVVAGRENPDQLIVNSNIGMAVCDVVVGKAIYDRALAQNAGTRWVSDRNRWARNGNPVFRHAHRASHQASHPTRGQAERSTQIDDYRHHLCHDSHC